MATENTPIGDMTCSREAIAGLWRPSLAVVLTVALGTWLTLLAVAPSGKGFAVAAIAMIAVLFGLGWTSLWILVRPAARSPEACLLALPAGIVVMSAFAQLAYVVGISGRSVFWLAVVAAVPGWIGAMASLRRQFAQPVAFGWLYATAICLIGFMYYGPVSQRDAVPAANGGMQWLMADTVFHQSVTEELTRGESPPKSPGFAKKPLCYHYGRHALAAIMVQVFGVSSGDALSRGVSLAGLLAVLTAAIAFGRRSASCPAQRALTGLLAVGLTFLFPSVWVLCANVADTTARHPEFVFPEGTLPGALASAPWDCHVKHFFFATSGLWACVVAFTVAALLVQGERDDDRPSRTLLGVVFLAVLGICLNGVSALCCFVVAMSLVLIQGWRRWQTYVLLAFFAAAFVGFMRAAGLSNTDAYEWPHTIYAAVCSLWTNATFVIVGGFLLLTGCRSLAILTPAWGTPRARRVLTLFIVVTVGAFLVLPLQTYPILILGSLLGLFAAAPLAHLFAQFGNDAMDDATRRSQTWADVVMRYRRYCGGLALLAGLLALPLVCKIVLGRSSSSFQDTLALLVIAVVASALYAVLGTSRRGRWSFRRGWMIGAAAVVLAVSFCGTLRYFRLVYADSWQSVIELDSGRLASLRYLREMSLEDPLLATSHHTVAVRKGAPSSYVYSATSGYPILLEGWQYTTRPVTRDLPSICRDNERIFDSRDASEVRGIIQKYGVTHILVEPEGTLAFDTGATPWLQRIPNPGSLDIFRVKLEDLSE